MGFFDRLKQGLFKTKDALVLKVDELFKKFVKVDEDLFEELEELLISADIGVTTTEEILDELRDIVKDERIKDPEAVKLKLFDLLKEMIGEHEPLNLTTKPSVILVIASQEIPDQYTSFSPVEFPFSSFIVESRI